MCIRDSLYRVLLSYLWGAGALVSSGFWIGSSQRPKDIKCPVLSSSLDPLYLRRDVGALSLFYRYCRGKCSRELSTRVPLILRRPRSTRDAMSHMSLVLMLVTPGWCAAVLLTFLPPLCSGILCHHLCFLPNLISLPLT